jgi:DNA-directed RNA polymerase I subunit RPA1
LAKLRLLERGLLEASQGVDDIQLRVSRVQGRVNGEKNQEDEGDEGSEQEQEPGVSDESPQEFIARINLYVAIHLARAPQNTRDSYKDALIYQTRKDLINEFLKACILKKCQNSDCSW